MGNVAYFGRTTLFIRAHVQQPHSELGDRGLSQPERDDRFGHHGPLHVGRRRDLHDPAAFAQAGRAGRAERNDLHPEQQGHLAAGALERQMAVRRGQHAARRHFTAFPNRRPRAASLSVPARYVASRMAVERQGWMAAKRIFWRTCRKDLASN